LKRFPLAFVLFLGAVWIAASATAFAQSDTTPPTLTGLSVAPAVVNSTNGPASVTVGCSVTDDASGVFLCSVGFCAPDDGNVAFAAGVGFSPPTLDGSGSGTGTVPQFAPWGVYPICQVVVVDQANNVHVYNAADLSALGFSSSIFNGVPAVCGNGLQELGEECDDGNVISDDGCSATCALEPCVAAPVSGCFVAAQAHLKANEIIPGKEKLSIQWAKVESATRRGDFGNPVTGTTIVALCLYNDGGRLIRGLVIDRAGQPCAGKPCWQARGTTGYAYKDKATAADGIAKFGYGAGDVGKSFAHAAAANNAAKGQQTGIAAALSGNTHPTIQLVTSNGLCLGATMTNVVYDNGHSRYRARKQ
jgi:cysteine-rich repeat protein